MACDQVIDSYDGSKDSNYSLIFLGEYVGQAFTMGGIARDICKAKFYLSARYAGGVSIDVAAKIYACSGTPGTDGEPTGAALATSDIIQYTGDQAVAWEEFIFSTPYTLLANTDYCIVLECVGVVDHILNIDISFDYTSPSHSGNYCSDGGPEAAYDCNFKLYSEGPDIEYSITVMQDEAQHIIYPSSEPQHNIVPSSEAQYDITTSSEIQHDIEIITDEE